MQDLLNLDKSLKKLSENRKNKHIFLAGDFKENTTLKHIVLEYGGMHDIRNFSAHSPEISDDYWISRGELTVAIACVIWLPFCTGLIWETLFMLI